MNYKHFAFICNLLDFIPSKETRMFIDPGRQCKQHVLPLVVMHASVALECDDAGEVDADKELITLVILHRMWFDAIRLQLHGLLDEQQLGIGRGVVLQLLLVQIDRLVFQLFILVGQQFDFAEIIILVHIGIVVTKFGCEGMGMLIRLANHEYIEYSTYIVPHRRAGRRLPRACNTDVG